jgi:hypothetical protein
MPPILEYGDEYAEPIPPYGDVTPPSLFAPYGEYADAFAFTAEVSDDGRDGIAGAPDAADVDVSVEDGLETEVPDDVAVEGAIAGRSRQYPSCEEQSQHVATTGTNVPGPAVPAAALSHGFGGDTDDMLSDGTSQTAPAILATPYLFIQ